MMLRQLQRWLDNVPLTDPVERQQATAFQWLLIAWIVLGALDVVLTVPPFLFPQPTQAGAPLPEMPPLFLALIWLSLFSSMLLLVTPATALWLLRRGRFKPAVITATLGLLLAHSFATFNLGITNGAVLVVFQLPIALAGLLAGRRLLLAVAGWSIALIVAVSFLQSLTPPLAGFFTLLPNADGVVRNPMEGQDVLMTVGFFIGVTVLMTILLDRFGGTLRFALLRALDREEELRKVRASLEDTVAERTSATQAALDEVQTRAAQQAELLAEIEQQRATIRDLSVPVIPISATTLVMPLVGALDSTRLQQLQEQSLRAIEHSSARRLVLDITGVPIVDTQVAQGLLMTVHAARLLGVEAVLVGIRPEVAQALVGLGVELHDVTTFSDLQSALDRADLRAPRARRA